MGRDKREPVTFFKRSDGLNTKEDPARLVITEKGSAELAVSVNVDTKQGGRVSRRKGYQQVKSGSGFHSLFPVGDYALCVQGINFNVVEPDFSMVALRTVSPRRRMSYVRVANVVYYSNGMENGIVFNRANYPWEVGEYVGPETTKQFSDPPAGHLLCLFNGRIYIAQMIMDSNGMAHHVIWYTEPFAFDRVDMARNYIPVEHRIVIMEAMPNSLIVGTTGGVYAFVGANPEEFGPVKLTDSPAVEGTAAKVRSDLVGEGEAGGEVILLTCHEGVCMVGDNGYFVNLTHRKIDMPQFSEGYAAIVGDRYLTCLYE